MVARPIATGVLAEVGRRLGDDEDLVDVLVVQLIVRVVLVGPVCELVFPWGHLLHLFVEHEVQFFLVGLGRWRRRPIAFCRGFASFLNQTRGRKLKELTRGRRLSMFFVLAKRQLLQVVSEDDEVRSRMEGAITTTGSTQLEGGSQVGELREERS